MASARAIKRLQKSATTTIRMRVLAALPAVDEEPGKGQDIAQQTGLTNKQTLDALNSLHGMNKVGRVGRKYTSRWFRLPPPIPPADQPARVLETAFRSFFA